MSAPPRPIEHLRALTRRYPHIQRDVALFRSGRGNDLPEWPAWCFIPMAAWHAVAMQHATPDTCMERAGDIAILGALVPWRYTQGIYQFDADLLDALTDTPLDNILPAGVFLRLPQWSIYIELPPDRFRWLGDPLHGFWASLEWDAGETNLGRHELRLLMDTERGLIALPLHLGAWTVVESLRRVVVEAQRNADALGASLPLPPELLASVAADVTPLLSLLLYLCSGEPEIDDAREPGHAPGNPTPRRVKTGLRLFPPDRFTLWRVGESIGAQLRADAVAAQSGHSGAHISRRAHIRRGHWHGYWTGPRAPERVAERGFVYHWLPPQIVGGE